MKCFEQTSFTKIQLMIIREIVFNSSQYVTAKIRRDYYKEYDKLINKLRKVPEYEGLY